jgi:hypothetical protein
LAKLEVADFVWCEPAAGVLGCVYEKPEACYASCDRSDAFKDENLLMSAVPCDVEILD